jgi:PAS domain S-box-containing protein
VLSYFLQGSRRTLLIRAGVMIAIIALIDWRVETNVSLGVLYLFPMLIVGGCLSRWQIALVAALCTVLGEIFDPFPFIPGEGLPRVILTFAAYFGTSLFVFESARNRILASVHLAEMEREVVRRREAEEELKVLVESSPAAIFTLDAEGRILLANEAAHRLLGFAPDSLRGVPISRSIPALANVPSAGRGTQFFRTEMECQGTRSDGEVFQANIWFSTYRTQSGPRLAAVVADTSDDLRDREESSLQQMLTGSKIVAGAICHEIRNICGATAVIYANLSRHQALARNEDFLALGTLIDGLGKMASLELRNSIKGDTGGVDLHAVLDELRIVIEPSCREAGIALRVQIPAELPLVWADRHLLLQAFLNLTKNSLRALEGAATQREIAIEVLVAGGKVQVRCRDTGPGLSAPERLFRPFQPGAEASGLGLYVSRALVRAFKGDLKHEPQASGCCFLIELAPASEPKEEWRPYPNGDSATLAAGRPHAVPREPEPAAGVRT